MKKLEEYLKESIANDVNDHHVIATLNADGKPELSIYQEGALDTLDFVVDGNYVIPKR